MKLFKLAAITAAVFGSSMAMAATSTDSYQYNKDAGVLANTTGAVTGTARTLFDTVTHPAAVSAEIGTLGYGANIAWGVNESTELQAGWTGMKFDGDDEFNSNDSWINYEKALGDGYEDFKGNFKYDVDFSNPYIGVQMRPFQNWFTVAGGVMVPRNSLDASITAKDNGQGFSPVTIDGERFEIPDGTTVEMKAENKNKLAPYATLGFRPNINNKWGGFIEAGAAYMGDLDSEVTVKGAEIVGDKGNNFEQKAEQEINDSDLEWYPIVKAGVTYRF